MKIKIRKQIEQVETWKNPYTGKQEKILQLLKMDL